MDGTSGDPGLEETGQSIGIQRAVDAKYFDTGRLEALRQFISHAASVRHEHDAAVAFEFHIRCFAGW